MSIHKNKKLPKSSIPFLNSIVKIVDVLIIFIALAINSYILLMSPSPISYEVSIYQAYPLILWINFILVITLSVSMLLLYKKNPTLLQGLIFMSLFINQLYLLLLPLFRGYFIYGRSDVLGHLGRAKDILFTGHVGTDNFYPIMHIFMVELNLLDSATLNRLTILLPAFFWIMLLLWYYSFIRNFVNCYVTKLSILSWILLPLGYWHTTMVGNMFSYIFMFLILGVWTSSIARMKKYLLILILYLALIYFHPLVSMYLFFILILFDVLNRIGLWVPSKGYTQRFFPTLAVSMLAIWSMWYLSFHSIQISFVAFWSSILNPSKNPFLNVYLSNINRYDIPFYILFKFFVYRYFGIIIFSISTIIVLIKNNIIYEKRPQYFVFTLLFIAFGAWSVANVFLHFVNFERSLRYVVAFSIPIGSLFLFHYIPQRHSKSFFVIVLSVLAYFSVFTVHMSPLNGNPNQQVSASEYMGMGWFFYNRNSSIIAYDDGQITQYRFYEAWYGRDAVFRAKNILFYGKGRSLIPKHFGYDRHKTVGELFKSPKYFIIGRAMWEYYNATIPNTIEYWRWLPIEYKKLKTDPTVESIYSSVDVSIYLISPLNVKKTSETFQIYPSS